MNIEVIGEDFSFVREDAAPRKRERMMLLDAEHRCVNKRGTGDGLPLAFTLPHSRPYDPQYGS